MEIGLDDPVSPVGYSTGPMISAPVAAAVTERAKSRVYEAIEHLVGASVLLPLSEGRRNRWWEAAGLLDLIGRLEAGESPPTAP